jgi:hypothetical protein
MDKPPIVVVYKKKRGKRHYMKVLKDMVVDDVLNGRKRKPPIPDEYELIEVGWGEYFIEKYKEEYNIKTVEE